MNPKAGNGKGVQAFEEIKVFFAQNQINLQMISSSAPREAIAIAQSLIADGADTLLSIGGDGTAFEVINGIMKSGRAATTRLGILPLGTGNSFLCDYDITNWKQVAELIFKGQSRFVDIGKASYIQDNQPRELFFHNVLGLGMMAQGCELRHKKFRFLGTWAYHAAFFYMLPHLPLRTYYILSDGQGKIIKTSILAVCNSQYTGKDMHLCPVSNTQDGLFDIIYTDPLSSWDILQLFRGLSSGEHLRNPAVHVMQAKSIVIESKETQPVMIDGELEGQLPMQIEVLPRALQVYV